MIGFTYTIAAHAQSGSFIHIQSENNNAFSVQWKGNTYTSSASGYLIIPQVPVGEQLLVFGFQDTSLPAYSFSVMMEDKPRGFTLKQSISNTWSLFDMVSFTLTKGSGKPKEKEEKPVLVIKKPAIPENKPSPPEMDTIIKPAPVEQPIAITDKPAAKKTSKTNAPPIQKIFDKANTSGIDQVYIVTSKGKADTVAIFIPVLKDELPKQSALKSGAGLMSNYLSLPITAVLYTERIKTYTK
jgi:hypothetical protein